MRYQRTKFSIIVIVAAVAGTVFSLQPAAATAQATRQYVALGDSVAAGAGLPLADGSEEDQLCARSPEAYPALVAEQKGLQVEQLACSGAKLDEGLYGPQTIGSVRLTPQIDRAFAGGKPAVITVTIGANDVRWSTFVTACYIRQCGTVWDEILVHAYLLDLRWELATALQHIQQQSNGQPPRVLFTGYYEPFQGQTCAALPQVDAAESAWLSRKAAVVNESIRHTVTYADFAAYVPIDFTGHGLCAVDSWVQDLAAAAPTHPTAAGQAVIAHAVAQAMR